MPDQDATVLDAGTYNGLLAFGDLTIFVAAPESDVDACAPESSAVIITVTYVMVPP